MARPLRIEYPGAYYHVMNRGNSRQDIFITDKDRITFLEGLADSCQIYAVRLIVYVLLSNHFHLILQTDHANLSEFMRHLLVTYTVRFNRRSGRTGHIFQGRYKSLLVEEDEYLLPLSRYIHLNPIRTREFTNADITSKARYLRSYKWSTLSGYCYLRKRDKQIDYHWLLGTYFSGDIPEGRRQYWQYVSSGIEEEIKNPFEDVAHQAILGRSDFVEWVKEKISWEKEREVPSLRRMRRSLSVEEILEIIKAAHGAEGSIILDRGRDARTIRQMAMELCYRYTPMTQREIGEIFGVDYSTVSQNRRRLNERLKSGEKLRKQFERIDQRISNVSRRRV